RAAQMVGHRVAAREGAVELDLCRHTADMAEHHGQKRPARTPSLELTSSARFPPHAQRATDSGIGREPLAPKAAAQLERLARGLAALPARAQLPFGHSEAD